MEIVIRPAKFEDAEDIGQLAKEFAEYLRSLGDEGELNFNSEMYRRDGFSTNPAFEGIVAENAGSEILGYLLYHFGYDVDYATRTLHIIDLYVSQKHRRLGIGLALIQRASEICREAGGTQLFWAVFAPNKLAIDFYEKIGGRITPDLLYMRLNL